MANQMIETGSAIRIPFRGRQIAADRYRTAGARAAHRITDRALIRKVHAANGRLKRAFDIVVAGAALIFLAPVFLTVFALIKLTDRGPIFYRHTRVGRQGARFACLKFRTMATDSEERLAHILLTDPAAAAEWEEGQKLRSDPRITKLGAFLRKSSIDELPQLWNVLRGDMSIVGPRPITRAVYEKRIRYDREYLEEWSWLGEFWILLMTIPAILNTDDAC